jgi:hypothetical protein
VNTNYTSHKAFKKIKFNTDPPSNSLTLQFTCRDLSVFVRLKLNFTRIMLDALHGIDYKV